METVLKEFFGHRVFRPFQKDIMTKILNGADCLVVMATGSGKSICYQMPPMITKKTAVVISPLISLMQDQVMGLKQRGIRAEYLSSAQTDSTVSSRALRGDFDVLYMTPEKACSSSPSFWSTLLLGKGVCLLAVDEAHCVSEWGHDFRHEYQSLHTLRPHLPKVPFVALTATATHAVREDIVSGLHLRNYFTAISSFDRPNIFYEVKPYNRTSAFREELALSVKNDIAGEGSTLIYCTTVRDVEEVTDALVKVGVDARSYHAQMGQRAREETHRAFATDALKVVVATVAFGMGIDKPDIRCVIHYGCPKSLEAYYQESGRCGRDGSPARSLLYVTRQDFTKGDFYAGVSLPHARREAVMEAYSAAQRYTQSTECRRAILLQYFGETISFQNCRNCDNCNRPVGGDVKRRNMAEAAHLLLSAVHLCGGRWGLNLPIDVLRGSKAKKIIQQGFDMFPLHGLGREKSALWWKALGDQLLSMSFLQETRKMMPTGTIRLVSVATAGEAFLTRSSSASGAPLFLRLNQEMIEEERKLSGSAPAVSPNDGGGVKAAAHLNSKGFSELEKTLYGLLVEARADLARRNFTAPYAICSERTLQKITEVRPSNEARFANVDGVNQWLVTRHGSELVGIIRDFAAKSGMSFDKPESPTQVGSPKDRPAAANRDLPKMTPAKEEAWRMWQKQGLTCKTIASLPDRPKPIKEETVIGYVSECVACGYEVDWDRFLKEVGLTQEIVVAIRLAVEKVGSSDVIKAIKEQLPESVTYGHIKVYLLMESRGVSLPSQPPLEGIRQDSDFSTVASDFSTVASDSQELLPQQFQDGPNQDDGMVHPQTQSSESFVKPPWISKESEAPATKPRRRLPNYIAQSLNKRTRVVEDA